MKNDSYPQLQLYNTYLKTKEFFKSEHEKLVTMYICGLTVYEKTHIGHAHMYTMVDFLSRYLAYIGYDLKQVRNYTDVGHLVSDADEGEDKMEKGARKSGLDPWKLADQMIAIAEDFFQEIGVLEPQFKPRATENIQEMIEMIQSLITKGYAYVTDEAIYFDVRKFADYERYVGQKFDDKLTAVRSEVRTGTEKKFPADFSLWFFTKGRFEHHIMKWDSPWGVGFPGWHIECSAMSYKYLGFSIDIHTGGEDHIKVHHANEIAQSEAATGKKFVNYWFHDYHLMVDSKKMSKSLGNFLTLEDVKEKGFEPMDLRYFYATSHYRQRSNFTWEALKSARNSRLRIVKFLSKIKDQSFDLEAINIDYKNRFMEVVADDLNIPKGLAILWEVLNSSIGDEEKYATILDFDKVLGFQLNESTEKISQSVGLNNEIKKQIEALVEERIQARKENDWKRSDEIRDLLLDKYNVTVIDSKDETTWHLNR